MTFVKVIQTSTAVIRQPSIKSAVALKDGGIKSAIIYRGPAGQDGSGGGGGVSFLPDPGPVVPAGEKVLWIRPSNGSYSLIVRSGA